MANDEIRRTQQQRFEQLRNDVARLQATVEARGGVLLPAERAEFLRICSRLALLLSMANFSQGRHRRPPPGAS